MLRNYLLVAWRNLRKNKAYTLINLFGLSISMSVCLLIILLVIDHTSYDNFHSKGDQIYRVTTYRNGNTGLFSGFASTTAAFNSLMQETNASIRLSSVITGWRGELGSESKILEARGFYADSSFFEVFDFPLKTGNSATALQNPGSIILSEDFATKLFPEGNAMGSMVTMQDKSSYIITGIVAPMAAKSHIQFDLLVSMATLAQNERNTTERYDSWENVWLSYNYIVLTENTDLENLETQYNQLAAQNMELDDDHPGFNFKLQALKDITPGVPMNNEHVFRFPWFIILAFVMLGAVVMVTATINYANLSMAKGLTRAKEVGIRKATGATSKQVLTQFLVESVLLSLLALVIATIFYQFLLGQFNSLWIMSAIGLTLSHSNAAYIYFLAFSIILGLVTGLAPSLYISKFRIIDTLKGGNLKASNRKSSWSFSMKKMLIGLQFGLATFLIISIFLLRDQTNHMLKAKYGFDESDVYFVDFQGNDSKILSAEYAKSPVIKETALASHHPAVGVIYGETIRKKFSDEPIESSHFFIAGNYIDLMGINLIAGRDFPSNTSETKETTVIVNETMTQELGYNTPADIIGESLIFGDSLRLAVIGVVADYHFQPLMNEISPMALRYKPSECGFLYLKLATDQHAGVDKTMTTIWQTIDPNREIKAGFLDEEMRSFYTGFTDIGKILSFIAMLAIAITCLGLLGMVSFHMKNKEKEIGIRKVLGAEFGDLIWSLSKEYGYLIAISLAAATPIAIVVNSLWINHIAERSGITFWNTSPAIVIVVALSAAVILSQTWKSCTANPVKALRND
uniref:ABC transporter permease n=1 Tax=Fulvivirga sp. TaxID=1931237 RepID=UPI0040490700